MASKAIKVTRKKPQHGNSVRVIFFFIAFGAICVYTPILIDDLLHGNETAEEMIMRGEDPTAVLEATAAGQSVASMACDTDRYYFGKSSDGHYFVKEKDKDLFAVDLSGEIRYMQMNAENKLFQPVVSGHTEMGIKLGKILKTCMKKPDTAKSSTHSLSIRR